MKEITFLQLIEKAKEEVKGFGYSNESIDSYNKFFDELVVYFQKKGIEKYDYTFAYTYFKNKYNIDDFSVSKIKKNQLKFFRACQMLNDINNGKCIKRLYSYKTNTIISSDCYNSILMSFLRYVESIGLSESIIDGMTRINKNFLVFLENKKICNLEKIDYNTILSFISTMPVNRKTRNLYLYYFRTFLDYLYKKNIINDNLSVSISKFKVVKCDTIPSIWNLDEIKLLLASIDRSDAKGKRNYAIILLALTTSMRGADIVNLKIQNIDFRNNKISFVQEKTKNAVELPLLDSTKEAIKNYILEARPESEYDNLFLTLTHIPKPLQWGRSLSRMIVRYAKEIKLKSNQKRGIHSFRHTVLNYLFNDNETSLATITEISGHSNPESLQPYIKTDIERLREFTLTKKDFGGKDEK